MRRSQPWLTNRSRVLRDNGSNAERKLWQHLRNRQVGGFKFVRQEPIGSYFGDFVCRESKLIVEVDGETHSTEAERLADETRTCKLEQLGYRIIRVWNGDVYHNVAGTLETILEALRQVGPGTQDGDAEVAAPHPHPLPIARAERWGEGT